MHGPQARPTRRMRRTCASCGHQPPRHRTARLSVRRASGCQVPVCRAYNGAALGRLDVLLLPYYERDDRGHADRRGGHLPIACLLVRNRLHPLGGLTRRAAMSNPRVLPHPRSGYRLKIPANIGVCVGETTDRAAAPRLEVMPEDRPASQVPGHGQHGRSFARNGILELSASAYSGCHRLAPPGAVHLQRHGQDQLAVFDVARDMLADATVSRVWLSYGSGSSSTCAD